MFLEGGTPSGIAKALTAEGIPTPSGKQKWVSTTVESILTNEKYKGDAILQKSFTIDFLTKKMKVNEGEVPQYYADNSHPAIVSREVHDMVQHEMRRRKENKMRTTGWNKNGRACFANRLVCADCGSFFGSKVWHSTDKYKRVIWQCNHKFSNEKKCQTPHLTEPLIEAAFIQTVNGMITNKDEILAEYERILGLLGGTEVLEQQIECAKDETNAQFRRMQEAIDENAHISQDQDEYNRRFASMDEQYSRLMKKLGAFKGKLVEQRARKAALEKSMSLLQAMDGVIGAFDEQLFTALVDKMIVGRDGLRFVFKDGSERSREHPGIKLPLHP